MARSVNEIKKGMTDQFMSDSSIRQRYGLAQGDSFDSKFSKVSFENILFFIVATAIYALESIFDHFREDVEDRVNRARIASIPWYHGVCLEYQHGDPLVYDESTQEFRYAVEDESKRVVKYASVRENAAGVNILVSGDNDGTPKALSSTVLSAFKAYMNKRKPAGVLMNVRSYDPDTIKITMSIQYDPLVLDADGALISNPGVHPVEDSIKNYVANIVYGGTFNKTKLIDAVQAARGVIDVSLTEVKTKPVTREDYSVVTGNNTQAIAGSFDVVDLENTLSYVQEL